jgi:type IV pilus assembly protein PilY1
VPANLALTTSVEWPTAIGDAYYSLGLTSYSASYEYIGYANPNWCYDYVQNTGATPLTPVFGALSGYFSPVGAATNHICSGHWSGNFLNWAWTHVIDTMRKTMNGGTRIVDTGGSAGVTILQKTFSGNQGPSSQGTKHITGASLVSGATPFNWSDFYTVDAFSGVNLFFSNANFSRSTTLATTAFGAACASATASGSVSASTGSGSTDLKVTANSALSLVPGCSGTATAYINAGSTSSVTANITASMDSTTPLPGAVLSVGGSPVTSSKSTVNSSNATVTITIPISAAPGTYLVDISATNTAAASKTKMVQLSLTISSSTYSVQGAVQVCSSGEMAVSGGTSEKEGNSYTATAPDSSTITVNGRCRGYPYGDNATPNNYKPIGVMQKYAAETNTGVHGVTDNIRYSIFGYLKDPGSQYLDGGVMRARMKSVGPYKAQPGASPVPNNAANNATYQTTAEWNTDGTFNVNPDALDATNTPNVTNGGTTATTNGVIGSGVANYLNKFGFPPASGFTTGATSLSTYKGNDSVSELYYMAARYYRNLGNLASHSSTATEITNGTATNDQFPVIENWDDPVQYTCSTNFILGVGDIHTWYDGNLPGSATITGNEKAAYSPTDDSAVNVKTATNYLGTLEGTNNAGPATGTYQVTGSLANIGSAVLASSCGDSGTSTVTTGFGCTGSTFYIAGLAFDLHVRDIRPDLKNKSNAVTVSTFWLDVMEGNMYHQKNQYWLAAKYGGFNTSDSSFGTNGFPIANNTSGAAPGSASAAITYSSPTTPLALSSWNTSGYVDDRGNYAPDQYYQASSPAKMSKGINDAFAKITSSIPAGSAAALGLSSNSVGNNNVNYTAVYNNDYTGAVQAKFLTLSNTGGVITSTSTDLWDARTYLPPQTGSGSLTYSTRKIATSSAQGAGKGVAFQTGNLSTAQKSALGATAVQSNVLNYLRGDQCNETASGTTLSAACKTTTGNTTSLGYRARKSVLGDIINSKPVIYSAPSLPYADAPLNPGYSSFKSTWSSRKTMLYVGGNDGMLHAFDATETCTYSSGQITTCTNASATTGTELFSYVPSALFTTNTDSTGNPVGLASLAANPLHHHYMVDGQPVVTDVDTARVNLATTSSSWTDTTGTPPVWKTILVSGLGKGGGKGTSSSTCANGASSCVGGGFFAIDVTDPSSWSTESAVAGKVLWEINQSSTDYAQMGYSYQTPLVIKTKRWGWTLVLTSGMGNPDGHGYFYFVNLKDGSLLKSVQAGSVGSSTAPAGLTYVTAFINDQADFTADALYAADLLGNLWRVDLTSATADPTATQIASLTAPSTSVTGAGSGQPVMTRPVVAVDPGTNKRYVFVGTGYLFDDTDLVSTQTQTFYAIQDGNNTFGGFDTTITMPLGRSSDMVDDCTWVGGVCSLTTGLGTSLPSGKKGFYIDLEKAATNGGATQASAPRINVQPVAAVGVVGFAANLLGQDVCVKGSTKVYGVNFDTSSGDSLGMSLLKDSSGAATSNLYYGNGLTTNLAIVSTTLGSGASASSGISLLFGLDTTAGGSNKASTSTVGGAMVRSMLQSITRLNWREVPNSQ